MKLTYIKPDIELLYIEKTILMAGSVVTESNIDDGVNGPSKGDNDEEAGAKGGSFFDGNFDLNMD